MKYLMFILGLVLLIASCQAPETIVGPPGPTGPSGSPGNTGPSGSPGFDGYTTLVKSISDNTCPNDGYTLLMGLDLDRDGILEGDEVQQSAQVCNGERGSDGSDGQDGLNGQDGSNAPPTAFTPVAIINPCGNNPGVYNEIFIKLANGMLLASFSDNNNGKNTRFSLLLPGDYITTDGDGCFFTVDNDGNIINERH